MSLERMQQVFADLVASPRRCIAVRNDPSLLDDPLLTDRERRRLLAMIRHRGMSHNCTLYRANRLTPIARSLPRTCVRLGDRMAGELEAFWASEPDSELQFKREAERFAVFLFGRLRTGALQDNGVSEDLHAELRLLGLRFGEHTHP